MLDAHFWLEKTGRGTSDQLCLRYVLQVTLQRSNSHVRVVRENLSELTGSCLCFGKLELLIDLSILPPTGCN